MSQNSLTVRRPRLGKWLLWSLVCASAVVVWIALPFHPAYQEWLCQGRTVEGLQSLEKRLPENPVLLYYLGQRLLEARRADEAVVPLTRAVALDLDEPRTRNALAAALVAAGRTREAYQVVRQFYETHPASAEGYLMLARFYLTTQSFEPVIALLKDAAQKFSKNAECWALLAIAQRRVHDVDGAEHSVAMATRLKPQESKYWFLQAQIFKRSRNATAQESDERALQLTPEDQAIQADYADYLARSGETAKAEPLARAVLQKNPDDLRASGALGIAMAERGDIGAFPYLLAGLRNDPRDLMLLRYLHRLSLKAGKPEEAKAWMNRVTQVLASAQTESALLTRLEVDPGDPKALSALATLMGRNGDQFRCMQYNARLFHQVMDATEPLLASARELENGGFHDTAQRLAEQAKENARTPGTRESAEQYLRHLRGK